jgi:hypothetical protein
MPRAEADIAAEMDQGIYGEEAKRLLSDPSTKTYVAPKDARDSSRAAAVAEKEGRSLLAQPILADLSNIFVHVCIPSFFNGCQVVKVGEISKKTDKVVVSALKPVATTTPSSLRQLQATLAESDTVDQTQEIES